MILMLAYLRLIMARLFVTPRELNFISDITKEIVKDIIGQKIYLYKISESKTLTHGIYNESLEKVYDGPYDVDCIVDSRFQQDTTINSFGVDQQFKIEVFVQYRDIVDKGIEISIGDFFSFGDVFYEITEQVFMRNIYGMPEHKDGIKLIGTKAREGQFKANMLGPTDIARPEPDAVQKTFVQQRGFRENSLGPTGDVRDLVKQGVLDEPITGPKSVSEQGAVADDSHHASAFYAEDD